MSSENLPSDIICEILSRTTLEFLDTCKRVSKEWNQLIYEPTFMPTYCQRTNTLSGLVSQTTRSSPESYVSKFIAQSIGSSSIGSLPSDMKILASCNQGILCCMRRTKDHNYRYYVCKPSTVQWQALPNPKVRYMTVAVAMVVLGLSPLHYKIIRISEDYCAKSTEAYINRCEIFESSCWRWREAQKLVLEKYELIVDSNSCVYANGSFHWKTNKGKVVAFHEGTESFYTFPLPPQLMYNNNDNYKQGILVNYQENLGFCYDNEMKIELWVWKGNLRENRMEWNRHMIMDVGGIGENEKYLVPNGFDYGGVLLLKGFSQIYLYQVQDSSFSAIDLDGLSSHRYYIFPFRSDFETIHLKTPSPD